MIDDLYTEMGRRADDHDKRLGTIEVRLGVLCDALIPASRAMGTKIGKRGNSPRPVDGMSAIFRAGSTAMPRVSEGDELWA